MPALSASVELLPPAAGQTLAAEAHDVHGM
jgi:hypothetical protein